MGLKQVDLTPFQLQVYSPPARPVLTAAFQVLRTETTGVLKAVLPAGSTVIDMWILGVASNAGTTATISVGTTVTATEWLNGQDVRTAGGLIRPTSAVQTPALPNLETLPRGGDIQVYAKYGETGTASTAGGPYYVFLHYMP